MVGNKGRKRKWELYQKAKEWVSPVPFPKVYGFDNKRTLDDFVKHFKISKDEAQKLVNRLIEEGKLIKCEDDKYESIRICSMCGKKFDGWDIQGDNHFVHHFGYGSKHDLEVFEADLCLDCFDKVVDTILPLFPKSPLEPIEVYQDKSGGEMYIQRVNRHDNDPY